MRVGMWFITEALSCTTLMTHHWGTGGWGIRRRPCFLLLFSGACFGIFPYFSLLNNRHYHFHMSWKLKQDVEDSIVEEQYSLAALFRDFQHFWKMCINQEFSHWWCLISRDGLTSNALSHPSGSAWLGKLPLASSGTESNANIWKNEVRLMMSFYHLP